MTENILLRYARLLGSGTSPSALERSIETQTDLSDEAITDRILISTESIQGNKRHLTKQTEAEIIQAIKFSGKKALKAIRAGDVTAFQDRSLTEALEVIVQLDGTRPSFLIRDSQIDKSSCAAGAWSDSIDVSNGLLNRFLGSVGRIGKHYHDQSRYCGTGFLVQQNMMITNHHVLQCIAKFDNQSKVWIIDQNTHIDFGYELGGTITHPVRRITKVVFAGGNNFPIRYHNTLDMAILELEPSGLVFETFELSNSYPATGTKIYTVGYPGPPPQGEYDNALLRSLFQNEYGCKRLAPGIITDAFDLLPHWSFAHDATSLGGSSGSVILTIGQEDLATGLHYGGYIFPPSENYAHALGKAEGADGITGQPLTEILEQYGLSR
ncbi:trypsin-like serine peptidase [Mucilaginibacter glaciei]|uniref:Serine protease n=1 Tax=Mucilaginibacter glaciei TaxID=2772109 RepID=A0A926S804_9SPHI|nr:serine protease [Mucilaginibacter glaciei]MBD1395246.1 trypsin-like peptidase domain-containing protein [Mucilaginibacter glaciei]